MTTATAAPVVTIDGPGGAGKGTVAQAVAAQLGWHFLDSGAIYRLLALSAQRAALDASQVEPVVAVARAMKIEFPATGAQAGQVLLDGEDVSEAIRSEDCGQFASELATQGLIRHALLERQRQFRQPPGLVADGRDMGTVVFADAPMKFFLTASVEERARRRHKQLMQKGISANLADLLEELKARDARDSKRTVAPLVPAEDATIVDTTDLSADAVIEKVLKAVANCV